MLTSRQPVNIKRELPMKSVSVYLVGSHLSKNWLFSSAVDFMSVEVVGESSCAKRVEEEIIRLQPQVVILAAEEYDGDGYLLLQTIRAKLPGTCQIVLGKVFDVMFRVRYTSSGANLILDRQHGPDKILSLLKRMASDLNRTVSFASLDHLRVVNDSANDQSWDKLFALMDENPDSLMFADHEFVLRHANPAALVSFKALKQFFPDKLENLIGKPVDTFHRKLSLVKKIIIDPRNLPYNTQIIIGPKTFDLKVRSVYDEGNKNRVGVIAQWTELPEMPLG